MAPPDDDDLEKYRGRCTRWLTGHGDRSAADLMASVPSDLGLDRYGEGGAVTALEDEVRTVLGKPAAAFFPSGTMAQLAAVRVHADRRKLQAIAFHPTCHLEIHEDKAYQRLHGLVGVKVGSPNALFELEGDDRAIPIAACRIAREQGIWTFAKTMPGPLPGTRVVEFTVGDASLRVAPEEVASVFAQLLA